MGGMEDNFLLSEFSKYPDATSVNIGGSSNLGKSSGKKGQAQSAKQMTEKDWERRFEHLLKEDLIDVDKDFYEEEILYSDPQ